MVLYKHINTYLKLFKEETISAYILLNSNKLLLWRAPRYSMGAYLFITKSTYYDNNLINNGSTNIAFIHPDVFKTCKSDVLMLIE